MTATVQKEETTMLEEVFERPPQAPGEDFIRHFKAVRAWLKEVNPKVHRVWEDAEGRHHILYELR